MADVRSLFRQQRAARRIDHPHAAYSESGKLSCSLCKDAIKAESLWEQHLKSSSHRQRAQQAASQPHHDAANGHGDPAEPAPHSNKRKHDSEDDGSDAGGPDMDEDAVRKKRSRTDMNTPARSTSDASADSNNGPQKETTKDHDAQGNLTPPALTRRTSTTPLQGVEIQIPSRPATPHVRDGASSNSTPPGPSPLVSQELTWSTKESSALPSATEATGGAGASADATKPRPQAEVDEDEWAAFEADIEAESAPYAQDATISAPAMSAEDHKAAAQTEEEEREKRRLAAENDLADEKEDATRAMETEFEEMEELEARVRKLKERREALRRQETVGGADDIVAKTSGGETGTGISSEETVEKGPESETDEDEDDEDDEDDDFMGFRYRA